MYNVEDLEDKEITTLARKALTMPKYQAFDDIIDMDGAQKLFTEKKSSESEFIEEIFDDIAPMISAVYHDKIKNVYTEHWFKYRNQGYLNFRADIYITGKKRDYLIEVKNPTHTLRESINGLAQIMTYNLVLKQFKQDVKLIYLSSVLDPMIIEFIKEYNLDIEVFFMNGKQTAHWENINASS